MRLEMFLRPGCEPSGKVSLGLVLVVCVASFRFSAVGAGKSDEAQFSSLTLSVDLEPTEQPEFIVDRFFHGVISSESTVFDRFTGPASQLGWIRNQDLLGNASIERFNAAGANMFASIGLDSLRTAATEGLPVDVWRGGFENWLVHFIGGTIGDPQEEHLRITSITYSDVRASWESANQNAGIRWGVRPWRTNPYLYVLAHAGHFNGQPLVTFEGRASYALLGSPKLEGRLALPLPGKFTLAGAASVDPARIGLHDPDTTRVAVTLERVIRSRGSGPDALFYVGLRSGVNRIQGSARQENLLVVGFSRQW